VSEVLVEITPSNRIARIVFTEVDGATTEFQFAAMKEDVVVNDHLFQFSPPAGVETIEGELGQ
jgi:outer membrane lipoprotein-sorting protein